MPTKPSSGIVVYRRRHDIDAIDEHSRHLVDAMATAGFKARYFAGGLASVDQSARPPWVLLQYNPYAYGRWGIAPQLVLVAQRLRHRSGARLVVMIHEAWVDMVDWRSTVTGLLQRGQLRTLLPVVDAVMTSTEALAREIGGAAIHLPVATNIIPVATSPAAARERLGLDDRFLVTLFGRRHPSRALDHAEAAIAALVDSHGAERVTVLNLGADAPLVRIPRSVEVRRTGPLPPDELSIYLWATDLMLLPFTDGVSTRRSTLMAGMAHGRAVLGLTGRNTDAVLDGATDALALTPVGDRAAFASAAVALSHDPQRLQAIGDTGRRLYETRFDWPVAAERLATVLGLAKSAPASAVL